MRLLGLLVLIVGVLLLAAGLALGVPFTGIFMMGFLGTGGREAGRELALFLPATLVACGLGLAFIRIGRWLRPPLRAAVRESPLAPTSDDPPAPSS